MISIGAILTAPKNSSRQAERTPTLENPALISPSEITIPIVKERLKQALGKILHCVERIEAGANCETDSDDERFKDCIDGIVARRHYEAFLQLLEKLSEPIEPKELAKIRSHGAHLEEKLIETGYFSDKTNAAEIITFRQQRCILLSLLNFESAVNQVTAPFRPEYEDNLDTVSLSFSGASDEMVRTQARITSALPDYTTLQVVAPAIFKRDSADRKRLMDIREANFRGSISIAPFVRSQIRGWMQDYGKGDGDIMIAPALFRTFDHRDLLLAGLSNGRRTIVHVPVLFEGGNVLLANRADGEAILCVGSNCFLKSERLYQKIGLSLSEKEYCDFLRKAFKVEEVRILGPRNINGTLMGQYPYTFHLDQSFLPFADGKMFSLEPDLPSLPKELKEVADALSKSASEAGVYLKRCPKSDLMPVVPDDVSNAIKSQLSSIISRAVAIMRGSEMWENRDQFTKYVLASQLRWYLDECRLSMHDFKDTRLSASYTNVVNYQSYVNGIIYRNRRTGATKFIMPTFSENPNSSPSLHLKANREKIEREGIKVIEVLDEAYTSMGNLHCLTGRYNLPVLKRAAKKPLLP